MTTQITLDGVALITGAGAGMGRSSAIAFAKAGAKLILVDLNLAGLQETEKLIGPDVKAIKLVALDITKEEEVIALIQGIPKDPKFGRLDYALNCAGVLGRVRGPFAQADTKDNDFIMNVNVRAQGIAMQEQLKVMLAQEPLPSNGPIARPRGSIVNWCSWVSFHGSATSWAYAASKHALAAQTKCVAVSHAFDGIRCNAVAPGAMNTDLLKGASEEQVTRMKNLTPCKRLGEPEEVANVALWLCSDGASYVNGAILSVDGGWNAM